MFSRSERKLDHISNALSIGAVEKNAFDNFHFVHNSLPLTNIADIDFSVKMGELHLSSPIFINAMTGGGGEKTKEINQKLAIIAKETQMAMAVGSQKSALRNKEEKSTYKIVRKENPTGIIFANIGGECNSEQAKAAVDMLEANAIQVHLNVIQELTMPEGDRDFSLILKNIESIVTNSEVPVIVKEVGFGMSKDVIMRLENSGVSYIDIGGFGGTNFATIENKRRNKVLPFFENWGIPTPHSILEAVTFKNDTTHIIASGGIRDSLDIVKSLSMGANCVGMAGLFLRAVHNKTLTDAVSEVKELQEEIKIIMTALGAKTVEELLMCPFVVLNESMDYLEQREVSIKQFSLRKK